MFFNKAWQRIQAAFSEPYRPTSLPLIDRIRRSIVHTDFPPPSRILDIAPIPSHFSSDGIAHFPINDRPESVRINSMPPIKPDVVILATGYIPSFPFLTHSDNANNRPYPSSHDADVRQIWKRDDPTIGFIGFIRPGLGAIPPLAEMQSILFTSHLLNLIPASNLPLSPDDEWHYRLLHRPDARVTYGVEHESYAYQLAKDIGIAPSFTEIARLSFSTPKGWRLPYIWAAGAGFNTKFRLVGPWKWDGAGAVMTGELWETVQRRTGMWGNGPLSGTALLYLGAVNLFYYFYCGFWDGLARLGLVKPLLRVNEPKRIMDQMARERRNQQRSVKGSPLKDSDVDGE